MEVYCKMTLIEILSERQHSWKSGKNYADVLQKVKDEKYNPNTPNKYGRNALHLAVIVGCEIELFKAILSKITNVNAVDNDNNTALMYACAEHENCGDGDGRYCRKKTKPKEQQNFYDEQEMLSLKYSLNNTLEMVKSLMQHKDIDANIQSKDSYSRQQTALMFAFKTYGDASRYDDTKGKTGKQILLELVKKSNCELFGGYQSGLNKSEMGFNALHFAVFYGCDTEVFDKILGKIKNVNQPTKDTKPEYIKDGKYIKDSNETALHLISMKRISSNKIYMNNVQYMLKKLLNHPKINVNAADEGRTALYYAIQAENLATVKLLIEKGIDYTISANEGKYKGMSAMEMAFKVARTTGNKRNYDIAYYLSGYIEKQGCCANGSLQACRKLKF